MMNTIFKNTPFKYIFLALVVGINGSTFGQSKPNILWITIEDTSPHFIGAYGNPNARTPYIDALARDGVKFTAAFSPNTVCSPSRTSIITGVRTTAAGTGHHRSAVSLPAEIHGFPYYLRRAGYYTTNNSKTDYNVANGKAFIADAWDESSNKAGWASRKAGQPFFAVYNFTDSHQSRTMTDPYHEYQRKVLDLLPERDRILENEFEMPPFYRDSPEMRKQLARVYNSLKLTDNKIGALLQRLKDDKLADSTIIFFFADHGEGIPKGKTNGINLGYRVPFVVYFPPMYKHLSPWGTHSVTDELVDFHDLAPTLLKMAGAEVPPHMKGRVLIGAQRSPVASHLFMSSDRSDNGVDMVRSVTDGRYMYSRNYMPFMPEARYINYMEIGAIKQQMRKDLKEGLLNPLQKSLFEPRPAEFLFDLQEDPWETNNLASNPENIRLLDRFRKQLDASVLEVRDVMFLPEYELNEIKKSPYQLRNDGNLYPLEKIYASAKLSGFRNQATAKQQAQLLSDKNSIVRYWAITGLRSQEPNIVGPLKKQIIAALDDTYPPVAITAAVIAWSEFGDKRAVEILKKYLQSPNKHLALLAGNHLLYVANKSPFEGLVKAMSKAPENESNLKWMAEDFSRATLN